MRIMLVTLLFFAMSVPASAKRPEQTCRVTFGFAYTDRLDNNYRGIQGKQLKEVQKKLSKYGDVCYTADDEHADYILMFTQSQPPYWPAPKSAGWIIRHS